MTSLCKDYTNEAVSLLTCSLPVPDQPKYPTFSLPDKQALLSHVDEVVGSCEKYLQEENFPGLGNSFEFGRRAGAFYSMAGQYTDAEVIWRRIAGSMDQIERNDSTEKVRFLVKLSFALERLGHLSEAKKIRLEAWDVSKTHLADDEPVKWLSGGQMALSLMSEANFSQAETLLQECFEKQKALESIQNIDTLATAHNLSRLYGRMNRIKDAETYGRMAVEGNILLQGADSSQALHAQADLAHLYNSSNRLKEAEDLLTYVISRAETSLGLSSRLVLGSLLTLISVYRAQKRFADATMVFEMARDRIKDTLGLDHSLYLRVVFAVAMSWMQEGKTDEALEILQDANVRCVVIDRRDNWDTIRNIKVAMIMILKQRKNYYAAEALTNEIVAEYKALGISADLRPVLWNAYFLYAEQRADPAKATKMEEFLGLAMAESMKSLGPNNMAFLSNLKIAQMAYEFLRNERKLDETEAVILELWRTAGVEKYSSRAIDNDIADDAATVPLSVDNEI